MSVREVNVAEVAGFTMPRMWWFWGLVVQKPLFSCKKKTTTHLVVFFFKTVSPAVEATRHISDASELLEVPLQTSQTV